MDEFDFTDEEIRDQLENLGYHNIPKDRLQQFKKDLERLVHYEKSRSNSSLSTNSYSGFHTSDKSHEQIESTYVTTANSVNVSKANVLPTPVNQVENFTTGSLKMHAAPPANNSSMYSSETSESEHIPKVESIMYPQPNISIYHPYERPKSYNGVTNQDSDEEQEIRTEYVAPRRQENIFVPPHPTVVSLDKGIVKRKTLRKRNGHSVIDESFTESEQDDAACIEERMRHLNMISNSLGGFRPRSAPPLTERPQSRPHSARDAPISRLSDDFAPPPQSGLIRPMTGHPHTRNVKRDDPVTRYQHYAQVWKEQKAPGEKDHRNVRRNVRQHMTHHDSLPKKNRRYFIPNNYVIPGERKHSALRWQIREDLAQGFVPSSLYD